MDVVFYMHPEHTPRGTEEFRLEMEVLPRCGEAFRFKLGEEPEGWFQDGVGKYTVVEQLYVYRGDGGLDYVHVTVEPGR